MPLEENPFVISGTYRIQCGSREAGGLSVHFDYAVPWDGEIMFAFASNPLAVAAEEGGSK